VLTDLRIVLEPYCEESDIELRWSIPEDLPLVQADRHSLLQVLLNLTKNSQRALESMEPGARKTIDISVTRGAGGVSMRILDNGPGIPAGQKLFQPLQKGADATGLGLYLSRAFMRSFRGDLRYDPSQPGCCFVLELAALVDAAPVDAAPVDAGATAPQAHLTDHAAHTPLTA